MEINIGITESDRRSVAGELSKLLADSYTLYLRTHNFHWNVTGSMFQTLHVMFEQQYTELATAVDQVAERIRALGVPAPGTYREFLKLTSLREPDGFVNSREMIKLLLEGHEAVDRTARGALSVAERARDAATVDLLVQRLQVHEKTAWMLRSLIEG